MVLAVASSIKQFVMVLSESPIRVRPGLMLLFKSVEATPAFLSQQNTGTKLKYTQSKAFVFQLIHTAAGKLPWALIYYS